MKKVFTVLAASLCMLASCNLDGEEPLEEGVMTPDEFFEEIEVSDAVDLEDGWWQIYWPHYQKDNNGNYKVVPYYGSPAYYYYYYMQNGEIITIKGSMAPTGRDGDDDPWDDIALTEPVEITINKEERTFSFKSQNVTITDYTLRKCNSDAISTINLNSKEQEDGKTYYWGFCFSNIGKDLPSRRPSYYDEHGNAVYE